MKPRWKTVIELIIALVLLIIGGAMMQEAASGGPAWKWLGIAVVIVNLDRLHDRWEEL